MSTSQDWQKMRDLILPRLRANWQNKSDTLRNLPTIPFQDPDTMEAILLSPNEYIREVEHLSDIGQKILVAEMKKINRLNQ